jgi:hypothetical protein
MKLMQSETILIKALERSTRIEKGHFILSTGENSEWFLQINDMPFDPRLHHAIGSYFSQIKRYLPRDAFLVCSPRTAWLGLVVSNGTEIPYTVLDRPETGYQIRKSSKWDFESRETPVLLTDLSVDGRELASLCEGISATLHYSGEFIAFSLIDRTGATLNSLRRTEVSLGLRGTVKYFFVAKLTEKGLVGGNCRDLVQAKGDQK